MTDIKIELGTEIFTPEELVEDIIFSLKFYSKINGKSPTEQEVKETLNKIQSLLKEATNG